MPYFWYPPTHSSTNMSSPFYYLLTEKERERAREGFVLIQNDPRSFSLGETDNRSQLLARQALIESCDVAQGLIKSFWLLIISLDGNNVLLRAIRSRAVQMNEGARGEGQRWLICKWIHYDTCTHTTGGGWPRSRARNLPEAQVCIVLVNMKKRKKDCVHSMKTLSQTKRDNICSNHILSINKLKYSPL